LLNTAFSSKSYQVIDVPSNKIIPLALLGILLLSIAAFPMSISSVAEDAQLGLPDGVDLCIPVEDSGLVDERLSSLGNIRYVESLEGCEVLVVGEGYLSKAANTVYEQLASRLACDEGFVIVIDGANELRCAFLEALFEALDANGLRMPVMPIENATADKTSYSIHPMLYSADIVAISFKPYGFTVIEEKTDTACDVAFAVNNYLEDKLLYAPGGIKTGAGTRMNPAVCVSPTSIEEEPPEGTTFIGSIGWKSTITYGMFGEPMGRLQARVQYYYCNATTAEGTFKFFFAYVQHWAMGFGYLGLFNYNPHIFYTTTDWNTDTYSDQVVQDWGPKNSGSNSVITYGVSVGVSGQTPTASASITYSVPGGLLIAWWDQGDPADGLAKTKHYIKDTLIDQPYTVEPSSTGFLDPEIGGAEPMVVCHEFWTDYGYSFYLINIDISFGANLYGNDVDEIEP